MRSVFIFNPETEIILGLDRDSYTPNRNVMHFRNRLALLPALYAGEGDIIAVDEENVDISSLPLYDIAKLKNLDIVKIKELGKWISVSNDIRISPWGWNKEIVKRFQRAGIDSDLLPSSDQLNLLRNLAHRKVTADFFEIYGSEFPSISTPRALESLKDLEFFLERNRDFCLKAPWSSSGRGVIFSDSFDKRKISDWAANVIRTQGAVMAEQRYDVALNFASEWETDKNGVRFIGLSFFDASRGGNYMGNILRPQTEIEHYIKRNTFFTDSIIEVQRKFIESRIQPNYSGLLGIDMFSTLDGTVNPCVEINMRRTMGHVAIEIEHQMNYPSNPSLAERLQTLFPDRLFSAISFI